MLIGKDLVFSNHSHVSSWWEDIRKKIAACSQIFHIYSFSMVCRAVAVDIQQEIELEVRQLLLAIANTSIYKLKLF